MGGWGSHCPPGGAGAPSRGHSPGADTSRLGAAGLERPFERCSCVVGALGRDPGFNLPAWTCLGASGGKHSGNSQEEEGCFLCISAPPPSMGPSARGTRSHRDVSRRETTTHEGERLWHCSSPGGSTDLMQDKGGDPGAEVFVGSRAKHRQVQLEGFLRAMRSKFEHASAQQNLPEPPCDAEVPAFNHEVLLSTQG